MYTTISVQMHVMAGVQFGALCPKLCKLKIHTQQVLSRENKLGDVET